MKKFYLYAGLFVPGFCTKYKCYLRLIKKILKMRRMHTLYFKLEVVNSALDLPPLRRIKPTCRKYSSHGLQPVQVRRWIKKYTGLALLLYASETMYSGIQRDSVIGYKTIGQYQPRTAY